MEKGFLCFGVVFIVTILLSSANGYVLHKKRSHSHRKPLISAPLPSSSAVGAEVFFEVSRPAGGSSSSCSALILQHAFAYTYDLPPAVANYTPPSHCSTPWDQIVLKWSGTCKGRQYDRIAAVWFGGVEILRTCTAEPTSSGIYWEVRKDVTRFASIFKEPQLVVLELNNVVDSTYTGIFNINLTLEFYTSRRHESRDADHTHMGHHDGHRILETWTAGVDDGKHADALIHTDAGSRISAADVFIDSQHFGTPLLPDSGSAEDVDANLLLQHDLERDHAMHLDGGMHDGHRILETRTAGVDDGEHSDALMHTDAGSRVSATDGYIDSQHVDNPLHTDASSAGDSPVKLLLKHDLEREHAMHVDGGEMQTMYGHVIQKKHMETSDDGFHRDSHPIDSANALQPLDFPAQNPPDLIIPISKPDGLSGGHWFDLATENDTASVTFSPPKNIFRATLEICVSFHGTDEFWYTNPPNEYLEANGLSGYPGNGPFREVQVFLDDLLVGAVWPFPVIFTGGINPLFWRPAAAIGAYNLPSYDVELTPFVGLLVDGNNHTISMRVTNAEGSWPLDANLHLWLDPYTSQTMGGLLTHNAPTAICNTESDFEGLDGMFHTTAGRSIAFSGYLISSLGTFLASVSYTYAFDNVLTFQNSSSVEIVTQEIQTKGEITISTPSKVVFSKETTSMYPFYLSCSDYSGANSVYTEECNLTHSFNQDIFTIASSTSTFESLKNLQEAEGSMTVVGSSVTAGVGALQQHYDFQSTQGCYDRFLHTRNYSTLSDITSMSCEHYRVDM